MSGHGMVFLGFGKYVRADRIYALEPIVGEERGSGKRTLVWVEGIPDAVVASRTQETILEEIEQLAEPSSGRRRSRFCDTGDPDDGGAVRFGDSTNRRVDGRVGRRVDSLVLRSADGLPALGEAVCMRTDQ